MKALFPVLVTASLAGLLVPTQASSLRSITDIERRLAKMEYMAAMSPPLNCFIENGFDYVGNDIKNVPYPNAELCCQACYMTTGCGAYSWTNQNGGTCWLKSGRGDINVNPNVKSALFYVGYTNPVCVLRADVDYTGNDIGRTSATKADDCCDICHKYAGCRAYTWTNQDGGTCWLKSKNGGETYKAGAMSAEAYPRSQPPTPSCSLENDVDYIDNDIGNKPSSTAGGCCDICKNIDKCVAFSWTNQNGGTCWLKSAKGSTAQKAGVISSQVSPNPPGPTCNLETDVDFIGNDVGSKASSSAGGCCDICRATTNCAAFSWTNQDGGTCYLKSRTDKKATKSGVISSQVLGNPPAPSCTLEADVDYVGNDIGSKASPTAGGCCDICKNSQGCAAFSWTNQNGGTCWLKSSKGSTAQKSGVISSQVTPNPPTPSCSLENDVDYVGNDIGSALSTDPAQCCTICKATQGCKAFSWSVFHGGTCWLKDSKTTTKSSPGVKSGVI